MGTWGIHRAAISNESANAARKRAAMMSLPGLALAIVAAGCGPTMTAEVDPGLISDYLADKPQELHSVYEPVVTEGARNQVLHRLRAGLAAMEAGHHALAATTFDEALLTIETIYGDSETAAKARGKFSAEDRKVFRGEPYERAMAYYYRGVLYLMEGDYENARASFRSGFLQDSLAEQEKFRGDFTLLAFLEGWASHCNGNGDLARKAYADAKEQRSELALPLPKDNVLVLADLGYAPVKWAEGSHKELLKIKANDRSAADPETVTFHAGGSEARKLPNVESVLWQAQTRGGREFDHVLAGKVKFKEGMTEGAESAAAVAEVATSMSAIHSIMGEQESAMDMAGLGAISGLLSFGMSQAAEATKPTADTRQWDTLPEEVVYGTYRAGDPPPVPMIQLGSAAASSPSFGGGGRCRVAWMRARGV